MRIVLIGPPGAGKSTQGAAVAKALDLVHLSIGERLRARYGAGQVPAEDVLRLMQADILAAGPCWILDGGYRERRQAERLDAWLQERAMAPDVIIHIDLPRPLALERMTRRGRDGDRYDVKWRHYARHGEAIRGWLSGRYRTWTVDGCLPPALITQELLGILKDKPPGPIQPGKAREAQKKR